MPAGLMPATRGGPHVTRLHSRKYSRGLMWCNFTSRVTRSSPTVSACYIRICGSATHTHARSTASSPYTGSIRNLNLPLENRPRLDIKAIFFFSTLGVEHAREKPFPPPLSISFSPDHVSTKVTQSEHELSFLEFSSQFPLIYLRSFLSTSAHASVFSIRKQVEVIICSFRGKAVPVPSPQNAEDSYLSGGRRERGKSTFGQNVSYRRIYTSAFRQGTR